MKKILLLLVAGIITTSCNDVKEEPVIINKGSVVKTFHLNYTKDKDWTLCAKRDFVVFDMFETTKEEFKKCSDMGATMLCYFSSQFEDWREDSKSFGKIEDKLDGWEGERWVDPSDVKNLNVMYNRLDIAKQKGCIGIDLDNVDRKGHDEYILNIFKKAREKGLLVSQKNNVEKVSEWYDYVDMYQNEQCQQYKECEVYQSVGKPVFNIEYKSSKCKDTSYMYSVVKDVNKMDKVFNICK